MNDDLPFKLMPATFLPATEWGAFVARAGDDERAIELVSRSGGLGFQSYYCDEEGHESLFDVAQSLRADLLEMLQIGKVVATGMLSTGIARSQIESQAWQTWIPNFAENVAFNDGKTIRSITICRPVPADKKQRMLDDTMEFLNQEKAAGRDLKKETIRIEAEKRIPGLSQRIFNDAYKVVFNKKRGRNRRSQIDS